MKKRNLFFVFALLLLTSCSQNQNTVNFKQAETSAALRANGAMASKFTYDTEEVFDEAADAFPEMLDASNGTGDENTNSNFNNTIERKLIKRIFLSAETKEFDNTINSIQEQVNGFNGYIENQNVNSNKSIVYYNSYNAQYDRTAYYTLRIPKENADKLIELLNSTLNITNRSENVEDITLTYSDTKLKKDSLYLERKKLNELLENATKLEDILKIDERLSKVNYEIQTIETRLKQYDNQVDYTTISVDIREVKELTPVEELSFHERITQGFISNMKNTIEAIQNVFVWFVTHIPSILTFILFVIIIIVLIKLFIKIIKKITTGSLALLNKNKGHRSNKNNTNDSNYSNSNNIQTEQKTNENFDKGNVEKKKHHNYFVNKKHKNE